MRNFGVFLLVVIGLQLAALPEARGDEKVGAVLLLPASDMDRELADDLTEVLISSVFEKSGKSLRIMGKESFSSDVAPIKSAAGEPCLEDHDCLRRIGKEKGLALILVGKVGKAANGYRLEIAKITPEGTAVKHYRKRISGDIGNLINEMDKVATWSLAPDEATLRIVTSVPGANLFLDGEPLDARSGVVLVKPGKHKVLAQKEGFEDAKVEVTCKAGEGCDADLKLVRVEAAKPIENPNGEGDQPSRSSLWPYVIAFGGVAVASAGGSVYTYITMENRRDEIESKKKELCPNNLCTVTQDQFFDVINPIKDEGDSMALWTNVLMGVAIGSAVTATTLMIIELASGPTDGESSTAFVPVISPDYSGFALELRF